MHIERILHAILSQLSKSQDGSIKRFQFKGIIPNIDKYTRLANAIDWLETAHIINKGEVSFSPYSRESWFKLLIFGIGVLGAISILPPKSIWDQRLPLRLK